MGVSSACSVMETTRTPLRLSMALKATACSRLRVNRENFQTSVLKFVHYLYTICTLQGGPSVPPL